MKIVIVVRICVGECYELAKTFPSPSGKDKMHGGIKDGSRIELSKKVSNDQELIQSDPISCPQNQKGNNLIQKLTAVCVKHTR